MAPAFDPVNASIATSLYAHLQLVINPAINRTIDTGGRNLTQRTFNWTRRVLGYSCLVVFAFCVYGANFGAVQLDPLISGAMLGVFLLAIVGILVSLGMLVVDWLGDKLS